MEENIKKSNLYKYQEPYEKGMLQVSNIHTLYYEVSGNPKGKPALILHGGPGGGSIPQFRGFFDSDFYKIIQFDQRGSGKSIPLACVEQNTTWDLVDDIEKIRKKLNIDKWYVILGGSWGSTLALAYSQTHTERVERLILRGVFLVTKPELHFLYQSSTPYVYPEYYEDFIKPIPEEERNDLLKAYYKRVHIDKVDTTKYCKSWTRWEMCASQLYISQETIDKSENEEYSVPFATIELHYFANNAFFESDNYLLDNCYKVKDIPTVIVHGRYDLLCPLHYALEVKKRLNNVIMKIVPDACHSTFEPGITQGLVEATDYFKN
jgi:proline iminopeptidase